MQRPVIQRTARLVLRQRQHASLQTHARRTLFNFLKRYEICAMDLFRIRVYLAGRFSELWKRREVFFDRTREAVIVIASFSRLCIYTRLVGYFLPLSLE